MHQPLNIASSFRNNRRMKRRILAAAAALLVSAAPPESAAQLYEQGVAQRHAGENEKAIASLSQVTAQQPDNADAHLQLGLALMAAGREAEAETVLRRTLELAPAYDDARVALARLSRSWGDDAGALAALEPVGPGNSEAAGLRQELNATPRLDYLWSLDVDGSYSAVAGGAPDWREGRVQLRHRVSQRTSVGAAVEASRRFGRTDVYGEARLDQRLSDGASFYVALGGTPAADFRPEWQIGAGGSVRVRSGPAATVLSLDGRQARYAAGDIQTLTPGIEQYFAGGRAWATGRWINIFDERGRHYSGWLARGDLMVGERARLFAGVADAPDVSEGAVVDTFGLFGGVSVDVGRRTSLRLSLAHEDRARGGDRTQLGLGLGLRF
jgi:YaiO family outer membrane protein